MTISAETLRLLLEAGVTGDRLVAIVESIERTSDKPARSKAAERQARYRAKAAEGGVTRDVTRDVTDSVTSDVTRDVTVTPLARVRDNITNSEIYTNHTTPYCADADASAGGEGGWPETNPPSRADLDKLAASLREAAGQALNAASPRLIDLSPILRLARAGQGPSCDLNADVLPTIRARSARAAPGSVSGWSFFVQAICEARDRRLSGAPEVAQVVPLRGAPAWQQEADNARAIARQRILSDG